MYRAQCHVAAVADSPFPWEVRGLHEIANWISGIVLGTLWQSACFVPVGFVAALVIGRGLGWLRRFTPHLPAVVVGTALTMVAQVPTIRTGPHPAVFFRLTPPLLGCLFGVWAGATWLRGRRARLWFVPKVALLTLLTLLGLGIAGWCALEGAPLPFEPASVSPEERQRLVDMIRSKSPKSLRGDQTHTLHLTEHQISALLFWSPLSDSHGQKVAVRLERDSISLSLSRPISLGRGNPRYLNLDVTGTVAVRDGILKFRAGRCRIGTIGFPPWLLHVLSPLATSVLNQDQRAQLIARATREIRVEPGSMQVTYGPLDVSPGRPGRLPRSSLVNDALRASLRAQVDHLLLLFAAGSDLDPEPSFNLCLKTAFALARERSTRGNAVPENRAAIFALGILLGHPQIEDFLGSILRDEDKEKAQQILTRVLLHGRSDWTQHFCVSAAITALSDRTISAACGALKEELDAKTGGSGFSFADTLADRAGTVFAVQATRDEAAARALQDRLAGGFRIEEVCPPAADLPEGISEADLQLRYGGVGGEGYRQLLAEIERRVAACAAYR